MVKEITWSKKALTERLEILDYWNKRNRSPVYSLKLDRLFIEKINLIATHPFVGKKTDIEPVRVKIARDYLIFYEIHETAIHILSIKDGRQNPQNFKKLN